MSEKVVLPREVAEAIEDAKAKGYTDSFIVSTAYELKWNGTETSVFQPEHLEKLNLDILLPALVNGYTVEQTKEERLLKFYNSGIIGSEDYLNGVRVGTRMTLEILEIPISGINDKEEDQNV